MRLVLTVGCTVAWRAKERNAWRIPCEPGTCDLALDVRRLSKLDGSHAAPTNTSPPSPLPPLPSCQEEQGKARRVQCETSLQYSLRSFFTFMFIIRSAFALFIDPCKAPVDELQQEFNPIEEPLLKGTAGLPQPRSAHLFRVMHQRRIQGLG